MLLLPALPIIIPLAAAILGVLTWRIKRASFLIALIGSLAHMAAAAALLLETLAHGHGVLHVGGWTGPVGISIVADPFGATLALMASWSGLAAIIYSRKSVDAARQHRFYFPLISVLLAGVSGAFLTGDLFNLYVWFEVLLMSSFVLLSLGGAQRQLQGAFKYVTLNLISSALFLISAGLIYGYVGTLNMADLAVRIANAPESIHTPLLIVGALLIFAFSIKAALFPLSFWLPASYHTPPLAISGLFAGLLTKVGVFAILRTTTLIFQGELWLTNTLLVIASITMLVGVLGAASQYEFRRVLVFHSISQVGYMVLGVAIGTPEALAAALLFIVHHNIVKTNLFFITGLVERVRGSTDLHATGIRGLYATSPALSILFLVTSMALAGIPPLSGFVAKLAIIKAGFEAQAWLPVAAALLTSIVTLYSMIKLWSEGFLRSPERPGQEHHTHHDLHAPAKVNPYPKLPLSMVAPCVVLTLAAVAIGIFAGPIMLICNRAGEVAFDRAAYVKAVLGSESAELLRDANTINTEQETSSLDVRFSLPASEPAPSIPEPTP